MKENAKGRRLRVVRIAAIVIAILLLVGNIPRIVTTVRRSQMIGYLEGYLARQQELPAGEQVNSQNAYGFIMVAPQDIEQLAGILKNAGHRGAIWPEDFRESPPSYGGPAFYCDGLVIHISRPDDIRAYYSDDGMDSRIRLKLPRKHWEALRDYVGEFDKNALTLWFI